MNNRIFEACKRGELSYLQSVGSNFDGNTCDENGANCLHYAARGGSIDTIEYLIKKRNFDVKKRSNVGATAAHDAAAMGKLAALQWLLKHALLVNDQDGTGATVTHLAARYGHSRTIEWLMDETEADTMMKSASGAIPIHFAVSGGNLDVVDLIVKETPRTVNLQMINGVTPVYLACQGGHLDILQFLVKKGGSVKMKSFDGMSCLHAAAQMGKLDCIKWLIEDQKVNPNDRDFDGATPLHFAASRGHDKVIEWLMQKGGAKVTLDNLGGSPLHNAAELGQLQCVKTLLANGCSADITDNNGLTAADLADKCYHTKCANEIKAQIHKQCSKLEFSSEFFPSSPSSTSNFLQPTSSDINILGLDWNTVTNEERAEDCESVDVFLDEESEDDVATSLDIYNNPDTLLSEETGECESSVSSTDCVKSQETGECENSYRRQLSQPDTGIPPPPDVPSEVELRQRSNSDISSPVHQRFGSDVYLSVSTSDISSVVSSLSSASHSQPENTGISVSGSLRPSLSLSSNLSHQEELFNAIRARRMDQDNYRSEDSVQKVEESNGVSHDTNVLEDCDEITRTQSDNGVDTETPAESVSSMQSPESLPIADANTPALLLPPPPPPPPPPPVPASDPPKTLLDSTHLNGIVHRVNRPDSLAMDQSQRSSTVSSPSSSVASPVTGQAGMPKDDLIAELKKAAASGNTNLRKTRKPREEGHMTCIYSFGKDSSSGKVTGAPNPPVNGSSTGDKSVGSQNPENGHVSNKVTNGQGMNGQPEVTKGQKETPKYNGITPTKVPPPVAPKGATTPKLSNGTVSPEPTKGVDNSVGDPFDPKNFIDKVDPSLPEWRRQMLARKMAESAKKETEDKKKKEEEENKYKHLPAWKRQLLEKREAEAKAEQERQQKLQESQKPKHVPLVSVTAAGKLAPWQLEMEIKKS